MSKYLCTFCGCIAVFGGWPVAAAFGAEETRETVAQPGCHPSYDPCVPIATDVDCAGGSGDGPDYVVGPVRVIGPDEYRLDRDHNGVGCER